MYYPVLNNLANNNNQFESVISKIDNYLAHLDSSESKRIIPAVLANAINEDYYDILEILYCAQKLDLLKINYEIYCPIKDRYIEEKIDDLNNEPYEVCCHRCDQGNHTLFKKDLKITFRLLEVKGRKKQYFIKIFRRIFSKKKGRATCLDEFDNIAQQYNCSKEIAKDLLKIKIDKEIADKNHELEKVKLSIRNPFIWGPILGVIITGSCYILANNDQVKHFTFTNSSKKSELHAKDLELMNNNQLDLSKNSKKYKKIPDKTVLGNKNSST